MSRFVFRLKKLDFYIQSLMFGGRREMILTETLRLLYGIGMSQPEIQIIKSLKLDLLAFAFRVVIVSIDFAVHCPKTLQFFGSRLLSF